MTLWPLPSRPICNNQTLEFFGRGTENNANPLPRCSRQDTDHLQCLGGLWIWRFPFPCYPENKHFQLGGTNLPKSSSRHPPDAESVVFSCCCTGQPWLGDTGAGSPCEHGFTSPCRQWCWVIYLKSRPQGAWPEPRLSRLTLFAQDHWGTARDYGEVSQRSWFQAFFHQTAPTSLLFKDFFFSCGQASSLLGIFWEKPSFLCIEALLPLNCSCLRGSRCGQNLVLNKTVTFFL